MEEEFDHLLWSSVRRPQVRDRPIEGRHCDKLWSECVCEWVPWFVLILGYLCGFAAFTATESEWALTCDIVVTSYGLRWCLSLGDPIKIEKVTVSLGLCNLWSKYINKAITRCAKHNKSNTQGVMQEAREGLWELDNQIEQIKCRSSFKFNLKQPTYFFYLDICVLCSSCSISTVKIIVILKFKLN